MCLCIISMDEMSISWISDRTNAYDHAWHFGGKHKWSEVLCVWHLLWFLHWEFVYSPLTGRISNVGEFVYFLVMDWDAINVWAWTQEYARLGHCHNRSEENLIHLSYVIQRFLFFMWSCGERTFYMSHDVACANEETRLKPKFYDNLRFWVKKKSIKSRRPLTWCLKITHALRVVRLNNNEKSSNSSGAMKGFNIM